MGLPQILISFQSKGTSAIRRSARGIVACILRDSTVPVEADAPPLVLSSVLDVDYTQWSEKNAEYLKLIYKGGPHKVVVLRVAEDTTDFAPALKKLRDLSWNYLTVPSISASEKALVSAWIKEQRDTQHKTFKAVLPDCAADHEGIINLTTGNITVLEGDTKLTYSSTEYCARIAGLLAGLSLERSCTYYVLDDIVAADVPDDANERIDAGELVIVFDSSKYMIGRGVNSLVSFTGTKGKDRGKIKIIEGMDMYMDDIRSTFKENYVGKVINDYDNKQALVAAINSYHRALAGDVLDASFENVCEISLEGQRDYLLSQGIDTEDMSDLQILQGNTASQVFLHANIKFVDAMEDLDMVVDM